MGLGKMFGGTKDKTTTQTSTQQFNLPQWMKDALDNANRGALGELESLGATTADERLVGFNPDELLAQQRVRQGTGQFDDIIGGALSTMRDAQSRAFNGVSPEDIQRFMNPYMQNVVDINKRETVRDADIQRNRIGQQAAASGAFGGGRQFVQQGELDRNLTQNLSDIQNRGMADAYSQALVAARQSTADAISAGGAIGNLATQGQNIFGRDTTSLAASGQLQRNMDQARTDFTYSNPLETLLQQQQVVAGAAPLYGTTTTDTQTTPVKTSGWLSKALGAATMAAGVATMNPMLMASGANALTSDGSGGGGGGGYNAGGMSGILSMFGGGSKSGPMTMDPGIRMQPNSNLYDMLNSGQFPRAYADGGHVKGYADGGMVTRDINPTTVLKNRLNPLERLINNEEELAAPRMVSKDRTEPLGPELPNDIFSTTPMDREALTTQKPSTLEGMLSAPEQGSGLSSVLPANLVQQDRLPNEEAPKSGLQNWIDNINLPLLKTGLALMASDKPFFEAVGEAGMVGVDQISKERAAAAEAKNSQAGREVDLMKSRQDLMEKMRVNNERIKRWNTMNQKDMANSAAYVKQVERSLNNPKTDPRIKQQFDALKAQLAAYSKVSGDVMATEEDRAMAQQASENIMQQMNELVGLQGGSGVSTPPSTGSGGGLQDEIDSDVESVLDFSQLPK
jgi:hypothetical protein